MTVWAKTHLACTYHYFKKYHFKYSILKNQSYLGNWTRSLSIIMLSFLLAFVQLTWKVNNGWFLLVFDDLFMEFINIAIGPTYIATGVGRRGAGWGGWWQRPKQRCKMTQKLSLEWLWSVYTCIYPQWANILLQDLDRCVVV